MKTRALIPAVIFLALSSACGQAHAANGVAQLSPDLLDLLRAEMREISAGIQGIALSIASGDWKAIQETGARIRATYLLERKLTPAQASELNQVLPERFKQIDAQFHQRAEKVAAAAKARDAELVVFHYSRMLESCVACHSDFAKSRFPEFSPAVVEEHHH